MSCVACQPFLLHLVAIHIRDKNLKFPLSIRMIEINMDEYVLEILEAKCIVIDWYWRNKILSFVTSRTNKEFGDLIYYEWEVDPPLFSSISPIFQSTTNSITHHFISFDSFCGDTRYYKFIR